MTKVTITNDKGQKVDGYIDDRSEEDKKKAALRDKLQIIYLLAGIAVFTIGIYSFLKRKKT